MLEGPSWLRTGESAPAQKGRGPRLQEDHPHAWVRFGGLDRSDETAAHTLIERVQSLRSIESDGRDMSRDLDINCQVVHA